MPARHVADEANRADTRDERRDAMIRACALRQRASAMSQPRRVFFFTIDARYAAIFRWFSR